MSIEKEHVDKLWNRIKEKYDKGLISEEGMNFYEEFVNHISFMHVFMRNACNEDCEDLFWKLYDKEVGKDE